jgi:hypothetical protein
MVAAAAALAAKASIHLSGPKTATLGSTFTVKVSGYFTWSKQHSSRPNYAIVYQIAGSKTAKACSKHGSYLGGGPSDKKTRDTVGKPEHFSAKIKVKAPKAGKFTLCAMLGNFPIKGNLPKPIATHHYTVH